MVRWEAPRIFIITQYYIQPPIQSSTVLVNQQTLKTQTPALLAALGLECASHGVRRL